jgi:hypothetical protein
LLKKLGGVAKLRQKQQQCEANENPQGLILAKSFNSEFDKKVTISILIKLD